MPEQRGSQALERFIAAGPWPQRHAVRLLVALARRPRGLRLLRSLPPAEQLAGGLLAMERFEEPATARLLGWDADAVVGRGRALRRDEGRP